MKLKLSLIALALMGQTAAQAAPLLVDFDNSEREERVESSNAWLEVDTHAFSNNIQLLQNQLADNTKICAIMKADAYGNGIAGLMPSIIANNVACVGITSNEEARVVRKHGYTGKIMRVRAASRNEIEGGLDFHMEELIGTKEQADQIIEIARTHGTTIPVHLALNTSGMGRNGLDLTTYAGQVEGVQIAGDPNLKIVGMMTHFPNEGLDEIKRKVERFKVETQWLIDSADLTREDITLHVANSYITLNLPEAHLDMVRPGGMLYGDYPAKAPFQRIVSFKTRIASLHHFPAGSTIGYGSTVVLDRDSVLANLPIGYSDGFARSLSNKAEVLINGQRAKVMGMASMNTTMVDVTDIVDVEANSEVVIFGPQGQDVITSDETEERSGRILPEHYTIWGATNPRIYR
ncbi:alanine racemase [Photobacterium sanguinicancri]|uniref:Broad specificity amino-acid racemase n=1 Tax=Photobacterium sanguinicancri TaxID=875932 RepID=A0ABX4FUS8_9GAMM|nr:alanine racemase [Photobacterium sanguinicancri]OZS42080.1 alanine racemase [Photobacterium sanguinicancri]